MLNKLIANVLPHMPKKLVWIFSKRYIAGETIEEGILASKLLNEKGIETTIDLLGEFTLFGEPTSMFEVKFPEKDIRVRVKV